MYKNNVDMNGMIYVINMFINSSIYNNLEQIKVKCARLKY